VWAGVPDLDCSVRVHSRHRAAHSMSSGEAGSHEQERGRSGRKPPRCDAEPEEDEVEGESALTGALPALHTRRAAGRLGTR